MSREHCATDRVVALRMKLEVQARGIGMIVLAAISFFLGGSIAFAGSAEMRVVDYPREVEGLSRFYVRLTVRNLGDHPLRACNTSEDNILPQDACVAVAYRKDKRPPSFRFSRVEVEPVIPTTVSISPGETIQRIVRIPTPDRRGTYRVYLYLITGGPEGLVWDEVPIQVEIRRRAPEATRRIWVAWTLLAIYGVSTGVMIYVARRRLSLGCED